jgi:outer membrane murein-binding lipoprotein Lpp
MKRIRVLLMFVSGCIVVLTGCVSQGNYDAVVKERDELAKQNRALQTNMKLTRNEKEAVKKELEVTSTALAITTEELADTKVEVVTSAALYDNQSTGVGAAIQTNHHRANAKRRQSEFARRHII